MHETDIYSCFQIHHMFIKLTKQFTTKTTFLISPLFYMFTNYQIFTKNQVASLTVPVYLSLTKDGILVFGNKPL